MASGRWIWQVEDAFGNSQWIRQIGKQYGFEFRKLFSGDYGKWKVNMAIASKRWIWEMGNDYRFEYGKWKVNMASRGWIWQGSWWASDGGECARKCFDRCTSHFCPICIQDIDANKNTITYTQKKKKHKYRHKCKYRRDLLSKLALILIWKMETVHLSAKKCKLLSLWRQLSAEGDSSPL